MKRLILIIFIFVNSVHSNALTVLTAVTNNGAWSTATTWSPNAVPNCGDSLIIPADITVNFTGTEDYSGCGGIMKISIAGTLTFTTGKKLTMKAGSDVYIASGGVINPGGGGGSSNLITIGTTDWWSAGSGPLSGPTLLPITLTSFTASFNNNAVTLVWTTATETNNKTFVIERTTDGIDYTTLGEIPGAGTSIEPHNYSFTDSSATNGVNYYKFKQIDYDGHFTYSPVVSVLIDAEIQGLKIYPNPTSSICDLSFTETQNTSVNITLSDCLGRNVINKSVQANQGQNVISLNISRLPRGLYLLVLPTSTSVEQAKLLVQ